MVDLDNVRNWSGKTTLRPRTAICSMFTQYHKFRGKLSALDCHWTHIYGNSLRWFVTCWISIHLKEGGPWPWKDSCGQHESLLCHDIHIRSNVFNGPNLWEEHIPETLGVIDQWIPAVYARFCSCHLHVKAKIKIHQTICQCSIIHCGGSVLCALDL